MPPALPDSLDRLLSLLRPAFTGPSFDNFRWLVVGFIGRVGEHTITGIWQAARLAGVLHHSRAHDFFARRRWSTDELGLRLAEFIVTRLLSKEAPIRVVIDDTVFLRSGPKVFAAAWHYDSEPKAGRRMCFGNTFVCLGILVTVPALGERTICLPLLFRLWRPARDNAKHTTKIEFANELVDLVAERFGERQIELLADGLYATKRLRELPKNAGACVRLRINAALYELPPKRTGAPGRPHKKGARLGTPTEIAADSTTRWRPLKFKRADGHDRVEAVSFVCLWYSVLGDLPVRVVLARDPKRRQAGLELAVFSTDTKASVAEILARYTSRWAIEVAFQQAKGQIGVGEARNRVRRAVERTVPFGFLCQTITILWYLQNGKADEDVERRRLVAPWYRQKRLPSFADMLVALRRELIRAEFRRQVGEGPSLREIERVSLGSGALAV